MYPISKIADRKFSVRDVYTTVKNLFTHGEELAFVYADADPLFVKVM